MYCTHFHSSIVWMTGLKKKEKRYHYCNTDHGNVVYALQYFYYIMWSYLLLHIWLHLLPVISTFITSPLISASTELKTSKSGLEVEMKLILQLCHQRNLPFNWLPTVPNGLDCVVLLCSS